MADFGGQDVRLLVVLIIRIFSSFIRSICSQWYVCCLVLKHCLLFLTLSYRNVSVCDFARMSGKTFVNCCFLLRRGAVLPSPFISFLSILLKSFFASTKCMGWVLLAEVSF